MSHVLLRNRYEIVRQLGRGAMGTVYEARDGLAGCASVALKCLWPASESDPLIDTLRGEFRTLATLRHPLLCRVYDFGRIPIGHALPGAPAAGSGYFLCRELVNGADLASASDRGLGEIAWLFARAAAGLHVLHGAGLRHGDFKPANAIVSGDDVRLIDFGLTSREESAERGGTLPYSAPEIFRGLSIDRRADLYALGVALFEVLTGELPSGSRRAGELIAWHSSGRRPDLGQLRPDAPPALVALVAKLIDAEPHNRLPTAAEVEAALLAVAEAAGGARTGAPPQDLALAIEPIERPFAATAEADLLSRCESRGGAAIIEIVGAPGSGRSAILTELAWRAELGGIEVVRGDATRRNAPLAALAPALAQIEAITDVALSSARPERLTAALARIEVPLAIVLDDADYADRGSRALIDHIAGNLPARAPIVLVIAREDRNPPLHAGPMRREIECPALASSEVELLTERALGRADPSLAARIEASTGGNLLHTITTLEHLARGNHPASALVRLPLPARLSASATDELSHYSEATTELLSVLAVVGAASAKDLSHITGRDPSEVTGELEAAQRAVRRKGDAYQVRRAALEQTLISALEPHAKQRIHASAVDLAGMDAHQRLRHIVGAANAESIAAGCLPELERLAETDQPGALELGGEALAVLVSAGLDDGALRVWLGELARLIGDIDRATTLLEPLSIGAEPTELRAQAELSLARALDAGGDSERAEGLFHRVAQFGGELATQAIRDHANSLVRRGKNAEALELVEGADGVDPHLAVAAAYARGVLGLADDAVGALEEMAAEASQSGDRMLEAAALHLAGLAAYRTGNWRATRDFQERALAVAEACGDAIRVGTLRMNLAAIDLAGGSWAQALERGAHAISLLRAAGARTFALMARRNHAQLLLEIGATEQARRELEAARREAIALGLPVHEIGIEALLGILAARGGDVEVGRAALEAAEARFRQLEDNRRAAETLLDLAELELDLAANISGAASALDRANLEDCVHNHPGRRARYIACGALLAALRRQPERVLERLDELDAAVASLAREGVDPLRGEIHRRAARAADLIGAADRAESHSDAALEIFTRISSSLLPEQKLSYWQDARRRELKSERQLARTALGVDSSHSSARYGLETERVFQLLAIYNQLSSEANPERLLSQAMEQASLLVGANRGFLLLQRGGELVMVASRNLPAAQLESMRTYESRLGPRGGNDAPYSRSVAEEVFRTGEPVIGDVRIDSRFSGAASVHSLSAPSVLCVPACAGGQVVGALYLETAQPGLELGPNDARLLAAFGDQVAVLLRDAELKRQLASRARDLEKARAEVEALLAERTQLLAHRTEELSVAVRENSRMSRQLLADGGAFGLVGSSPAMETVYELIDRVANADVPVLIVGESGTGKELVARAIHARSPRAGRPMVAVNCGALPQTLLESELFGHVRGAFTGATRDRRGLFETASRSTLFLDEISETPPRMQASLLRAIQEGVVRPVGGSEVEVDVRVVCASNRDLRQLAETGEFRADLLYRLEVVTIEIPPLRRRRGDIPLLCEHFLSGLRTRTGRPDLAIGSDALRQLFDHDWPGNVRQLEHALTSATLMAKGAILLPSDFDNVFGGATALEAHADSERAEILSALETSGWNRSKAARALGIPRRTFYRRLARYGIQ